MLNTSIFLRLCEVKRRTGLSRSSIYMQMSKGKFPTSISLGERAVGWLEHEISQWIERQVSLSRNGSSKAVYQEVCHAS